MPRLHQAANNGLVCIQRTFPVDRGLLSTGERAKQDEEMPTDIEVVFKTHRNNYGSPLNRFECCP